MTDGAQRATYGAPPRPRPAPPPTSQVGYEPDLPHARPAPGVWRSRSRVAQLTRLDQQAAQAAATAASNAVVTAARVGRLLGRSSWRIARQLPVVEAVEKQTERLRQTAAHELLRLLEVPPGRAGAATPEEQRVMMLIHNNGDDPEPLRTAMTELLSRTRQPDATDNRDYLYGTIISQLVPDEARILAVLADGRSYAMVDVVAKSGRRSPERTLVTDVSTVGSAAGVVTVTNTPTYLGRLRGFGLVDVGPEGNGELVEQYVQLAEDPAVVAARAGTATRGSHDTVRLVRRTVRLSAFGAQFWAACAPANPALGPY